MKEHLEFWSIKAFVGIGLGAGSSAFWRSDDIYPALWGKGQLAETRACLILPHHTFWLVDDTFGLPQVSLLGNHSCEAWRSFSSLIDLLNRKVARGSRIGYDVWRTSQKYHSALSKIAHYTWVSCSLPQPEVACDRPPKLYPLEASGQSSWEKRKSLAKALKVMGLPPNSLWLVTHPDQLAWLLNLRGSDFLTAPLWHGYGFVDSEGFTYVMSPHDIALRKIFELNPDEGRDVLCYPWKDLINSGGLSFLCGGSDKLYCGPSTHVSEALALKGVTRMPEDPLLALQSLKNKTEISGMHRAQTWDDEALILFLEWLSRRGPQMGDTELSLSNVLESFRRRQPSYTGPSFETISAYGHHSAILHYHPTFATDLPITWDNVYLLDSGGQYEGAGTTDITRTISLGSPSSEHKKYYTAVLRGHISLASAVFPQGTTGGQLDALARNHLLALGVDYPHSTGHGIGSYLSVHEGGVHISTHSQDVLRPGMFVSNEPGFYLSQAYGIRLENCVEVIELSPGTLALKTLSRVPFDPNLIEISLLTPCEKEWLNNYHEESYQRYHGLRDSAFKEWLRNLTHPL